MNLCVVIDRQSSSVAENIIVNLLITFIQAKEVYAKQFDKGQKDCWQMLTFRIIPSQAPYTGAM